MKCWLSLAVTALLISPIAAEAGQRDMVPSCFDLVKMTAPKSEVKREIFVIIDQTAPVDDEQQKALVASVMSKIAPETAITVITFSAFIADHYADLKFSGLLDRHLSDSERDDTPKKELRAYDSCIAQQVTYMQGKVADAMREGYGKPTDNIARSDILATLKDVSSNIVTRSPAKQKDVLLISDMLENSSISSFYAKNNVRLVDPKAEMVKAAGSIGDFGGAKIYIAGAGSIVVTGRKQVETYRDPKTMDALEAFWREYFVKSNADLVAFGKPAIMGQF